MQEPTGQQQVFVTLTWPLAQLLRLLQGTSTVLYFSQNTVDYVNRKDLFSSFSEKVNFQQDNAFHSKHGYNILDISGTCLRLITFHIGIRIHLVKQKCPFSSLFHNKFGLYKAKHFFIQNNLLYLTTQLLKSCICQYGSLAQGLSSYLSIFHFKGFLISALHIIYKI